MVFFPHLPLHLNAVALFGVTLILGLIGAEIAKFTRFLPSISGYLLVGFLFGPSVFNLATPSLLKDASFFVDIALGLILFDLGRHLDFKWLRHDKGLLIMSIAESAFTFILVFGVLIAFHIAWLSAALVATIAIATSPAVVMMVTHDLAAEGPITRRTLILTSLNNLFALVLFTILLPLSYANTSVFQIVLEYIPYRLFGSVCLGGIMFLIAMGLARLTGKYRDSQFILFVGTVALSIGLAIALNLSTMLTLFVLGVAARNFDLHHNLTEVDFGWLARIFFVLLFVVTGVYLRLHGLWEATWIVLAFLGVKIISKMLGVALFSSKSRLTRSQCIALGLTLTPMAELAIGISNKLFYDNPNFSDELITITTTVVAILYILAPIAAQVALIKTGEVARVADRAKENV